MAHAFTRSVHVLLLIWSFVLKVIVFSKNRNYFEARPASLRARIRSRIATYHRACLFLFLIHSAACGPPGFVCQHNRATQAQHASARSTAFQSCLSLHGGFQQPCVDDISYHILLNSRIQFKLANVSLTWFTRMTWPHFEARKLVVGWLTPLPCPSLEIVNYLPLLIHSFPPSVFSPCKGFPGEGPGDDISFSMTSINVTSCSKNVSALFALGADRTAAPLNLCLMQETRIHPLKRNSIVAAFRQEGWSLVIGAQPPVQKVKAPNGKPTYRQMHGGLAIAYRGTLCVTEDPIPVSFGIAHVVQSALCICDSFSIRIVNCYLPSGQKNKFERRELMQRIFEFVASAGPGPIFIGGDFNDSPDSNPSISQVLQSGEFCDVVHEHRIARGLDVGHTFFRTKKLARSQNVARPAARPISKTRIDFFLTSSSANQCVTNAWHSYGTAFPNHVPVCLELTIPVSSMKAFRLSGSPQWSFPKVPKTQQEWDTRDEFIRPIVSEWIPKILPSVQDGCVEDVWTIACDATKAVLNNIALHQIQSSKGSPPKFVEKSTRKPLRDCSSTHVRRNKISALFREVGKKFDLLSPQRSFLWKTMLSRTVKNLRTNLHLVGFPESQYYLTSRIELDQLQKDFQSFCSKQDYTDQINGIRNWKKRLRISNSKDKKQVYRWIKGGFSGAPNFIRLPDGNVSGSISTMLEAVSTKMEGIYNTHADCDPNSMIDTFENKYGSILDELNLPCHIPPLNDRHFFDACQKKDVSKAAGMDGWRYHDLKHLPPTGWVFFRLVAMTAEAFGKWPTPISCVSLSTIPKGNTPFLDADNVRAIGITSIVYSLWSSVRFLHISDWMGKLAPASLLGGIHGRDATPTEIQVSLDFKACVAREEAIAVFVDRFKCFDLIIPQVSLHCAKRLGMPDQVVRACLAFYSNQMKFFKIAGFYGRKVMSTNSAVQGCSMSIVMINCAYAVLAKQLENVAPQISMATFIDDCKIWGPLAFEHQVADAFDEICKFDESIGQRLNPTKSEVLGTSKAKAKSLNSKLRVPLTVKPRVKSLGRSLAMNNQKNSVHQTARVAKALQALHKVRQLPLGGDQKAMFIQSVVHAAWIYGAETQGLTRKSISQLRTQIARAICSSKGKSRSPFLILSTQKDAFLDPVARWTQHVFRLLRKLANTHSQLVTRALEWAKSNQSNRYSAVNGFAQVVSFLITELQWEIVDPNSFIFRSYGEVWCLTHYSDSYFMECMADRCRTFLIQKLPKRAEGRIEQSDCVVDGFLTRFLLDSPFSNLDDFQHLQPHLVHVPKDIGHARNLLKTALSGNILSGPRLQAAGMSSHDTCHLCQIRDTHDHIFNECPLYEHTRPLGHGLLPQISRNTGVVFRRACVNSFGTSHESVVAQLPANPIQPGDIVFTDGSCFSQKWRQARVAASAVHIPGQFNFAALLPGPDQTSQRAELYAIVLAVLATTGNITIASDCQSIVIGFALLKRVNFQLSQVQCLDNRDWWELLCTTLLSRAGQVEVIKVKAHCCVGDLQQPDHWTRGNAEADRLAKECAEVAWESSRSDRTSVIQAAVSNQIHIIATLRQRFSTNFPSVDQDQPEVGDGDFSFLSKSFQCNCNPSRRVRGKQTVCTNMRNCQNRAVLVAKPEINFIQACENGTITHSHLQEIRSHYQIFSLSFRPHPANQSLEINLDPANLIRKHSKLPSAFAHDLIPWVRNQTWYLSPDADGAKTPWLLVFLAFCSSKKDTAKWFKDMPLHRSVCQFRTALGWIWKDQGYVFHGCKQITSLMEFGFGRLSGFFGTMNFNNPLPIWYFLLRSSIDHHSPGNPPKISLDILHSFCLD